MFTATKDAEAKLLETIGSIKDESNSWRGMHFRFSQLLEHYRSDYQIKIAKQEVTLKEMKTYINWMN